MRTKKERLNTANLQTLMETLETVETLPELRSDKAVNRLTA